MLNIVVEVFVQRLFSMFPTLLGKSPTPSASFRISPDPDGVTELLEAQLDGIIRQSLATGAGVLFLLAYGHPCWCACRHRRRIDRIIESR